MNHSCKGQSSRLECAWIYQFAPVPKDIQATAVVKGPFSSTLLMETTPIIEMLVNLPKNRERVSLRTGIPDSCKAYQTLGKIGLNDALEILTRDQHVRQTTYAWEMIKN
ncbi:uncharacterized protein LOC119659302 [Hermetia illucens]|uniref:uncharacterized protein LOC119659302 n=1 Tax=Hermetia illucens TaxID=343691 RepID=UPI0018CC5A29|nr:uncharacterized protein LOC119659302 [Hermetia illucens]